MYDNKLMYIELFNPKEYQIGNKIYEIYYFYFKNNLIFNKTINFSNKIG